MADRDRLFTGGGDTLPEPDLPPPLEPLLRTRGAYLPSEGVRDAVEVALLVGQPLLLTGEPGTGKSTLARALAHERFGGRLLEMQVKSDTGRADLLYRIDELARFRDSQPHRTPRRLLDYVELQPLGEGILRACGPDLELHDRAGRKLTGREPFLAEVFGPEHRGVPTVRDLLGGHVDFAEPQRCVVLIDEIDKASRDTPNDLLEEFDRMSFAIPELQLSIRPPDDALRPVVVVTSNSEKSLPTPFCAAALSTTSSFPSATSCATSSTAASPHCAWSMDGWASSSTCSTSSAAPCSAAPGTAELLHWLHVADQDPVIRAGTRADCVAPLGRTMSVITKIAEDVDRTAATLRDWATKPRPS